MFDVCYLLTICLKGKENAVGGDREEGILENQWLLYLLPSHGKRVGQESQGPAFPSLSWLLTDRLRSVPYRLLMVWCLPAEGASFLCCIRCAREGRSAVLAVFQQTRLVEVVVSKKAPPRVTRQA